MKCVLIGKKCVTIFNFIYVQVYNVGVVNFYVMKMSVVK